MIIKESAENYLESILRLGEIKSDVRSIDIAEDLNISKPSVSVAMKNFRENGYIEVSHEGYITLTEKGLEIANRTYLRHKLIKDLFVKIGVSPKTADSDACKIEHDISDETYEKLEELYKKL